MGLWKRYTEGVDRLTGKIDAAADRMEAAGERSKERAERMQKQLDETPSFAELSVGWKAEMGFAGAQVRNGEMHYHGRKYPMAGITAEVEVGATTRRMTATRIAAGTVIAPGVGTVVGAAARKAKQRVFVNLLIADGRIIVIAVDAKKEAAARKFAHSVNNHPTAQVAD